MLNRAIYCRYRNSASFLNTVDKQILFFSLLIANVSKQLLQSEPEKHLWIWKVKCTKVLFGNGYFSQNRKILNTEMADKGK